MKNCIFAIAGICAAAAGLLVWGAKRTPNLQDIPPSFDEPWADGQTAI